MPMKFEWDLLDPGSFHLDHVLNSSNGDTEAEFYSTSPGISPTTLPNDDIWKKFDMNDDFGFEMCEDAATATWMNPTYTKTAREIMNHDCMWAGHCVSDKHERYSQKNQQKCTTFMPIKKPAVPPPTPKIEEPKVIAVTTPDGTMTADGSKICGKKNAVVAPTHARSILLPSRIISNTPPKNTTPKNPSNNSGNRYSRSKTLDSGGESPRPETPQSLSDSEDLDLDFADMKSVEDFVVDTFGNFQSFVNDIVNSESSNSNDGEDPDDFDIYLDSSESELPISNGKNVSISPSKVTAVMLNSRTNVKQEVPIPRHYITNSFFSDHCYHLSKNARMDHLGVQTPSDSEEEIDVETVYGDSKKPNSRSSSSGGVLPTNPSFSDRQQLQLTVASAINKKEVKKPSARTSTVPPRYSLDDRTLKPKVVACKRKNSVRNSEIRRTGSSNKRSAQFDDYECVTKSVKRKKYQYQRHFKSGKTKKSKSRRNHVRNSGGSSESEEDSCQKRSMHNSMERQRRIDLRNAFEELRKLVPHTADNEKAAKVVILSSGAEFCQSLAQEEAELTRKRAELRRQQEMLRAKVSQLRRSLAVERSTILKK